MSFALDWLDLREPADRAARDRDLLERARAYLAADENPLAVDLGAGSGATVRAFGGRPPMRWRLVDNDTTLLAAAQRCGPDVTTVHADLRDLDDLPLADARLVTASALFDLTGAAWIAALVGRLAAVGVGLYAALTYDGRLVWEPADAEDAAIAVAFNRHQDADKGLGQALGPAAGAHLAAALRAEDYRVRIASSPWRLGPAEAALQQALLSGIAQAAAETGFEGAAAWRQRRVATLSSGSLLVGHVDVLALPAG